MAKKCEAILNSFLDCANKATIHVAWKTGYELNLCRRHTLPYRNEDCRMSVIEESLQKKTERMLDR